MTSTKVVIRVLTETNDLLGAVVHQAAVKGDACLRATGAVVISPDVSGVVSVVSVHWCDVNVEVRIPCQAATAVGVPLIFFPHDAVLITAGTMPSNLPPITLTTPVVATPLTGGIGARGC